MRCEGVRGVVLRRLKGKGRVHLRYEVLLSLCRDSTSGRLSRIQQMNMETLPGWAAESFHN